MRCQSAVRYGGRKNIKRMGIMLNVVKERNVPRVVRKNCLKMKGDRTD